MPGLEIGWDLGVPPEFRYQLYSKEDIFHKAILCSGGLKRENCILPATHLVPSTGGAHPVCGKHLWGSGRCKLDGPLMVHWEAATGIEVDEDGQRHEPGESEYDEYDDE